MNAFVAARRYAAWPLSLPDRHGPRRGDGGGGGLRASQLHRCAGAHLPREGFERSGEFELAVLLAILMFGSGLVFVRSMERWL